MASGGKAPRGRKSILDLEGGQESSSKAYMAFLSVEKTPSHAKREL